MGARFVPASDGRRAPREYRLTGREPWALASVLALCCGVVAAFVVTSFPSWSAGAVLATLLGAAALAGMARRPIEGRLGQFFGLLAIVDFLKRATFLVSGQQLWSQYLVLALPVVLYAGLILLPWLVSTQVGGWDSFEVLCLAYIGLALVSTWLSPGYSIQAKAAASALLILPWTMLFIAAGHSDAGAHVSHALTFWGVASVLYGLIQFCLGPTPVETRWAEVAGDLSVGASHLAGFLRGEVAGPFIWRVNGLQPDAFTFGMFILTALTAARLRRIDGRLAEMRFRLISAILVIGLGLSLVRTIWVAAAISLIAPWIVGRLPVLLRPRFLLPGLVAVFVASNLLANSLYSLAWVAGQIDNPLFARAVTLGTLEARRDALEALLEASSTHGALGVGYAASTWIADKFAEGGSLPPNFAAHNVVVEQVWYVGLPGLVLFFAVLGRVFQEAGQTIQGSDRRRRERAAILAGYLLAMFVSGLGNGGVFLGYYFFFFAGLLVAEKRAAALGGRAQ